MSVLQTGTAALRWRRGRICQFQQGHKTGAGDRDACRGKSQNPLPPPPAPPASAEPIPRQQGGKEAGLWSINRGGGGPNVKTYSHEDMK